MAGPTGEMMRRLVEAVAISLYRGPQGDWLTSESITEDARFREDLGRDSIDMAEVFMNVEEEFGIVIRDEEAQPIQSVRQLICLVESKCPEPHERG